MNGAKARRIMITDNERVVTSAARQNAPPRLITILKEDSSQNLQTFYQ